MQRYVIIDDYDGQHEVVNSIDAVLDYFRDNEVAERGWKGDHPTVYEIGEEVKIKASPVEYAVEKPTDIPPPLPGESVTDYARRITNG